MISSKTFELFCLQANREREREREGDRQTERHGQTYTETWKAMPPNNMAVLGVCI